MAQTLQTEPRPGARKQPAALVLGALGVVYGDIGTSTLYGLKQAVEAGGAPTPDSVMGIVSLILWSLLLIVALKYAILILRADNHGEGGIVALLAWRMLHSSMGALWFGLNTPLDGRARTRSALATRCTRWSPVTGNPFSRARKFPHCLVALHQFASPFGERKLVHGAIASPSSA